MRQSETPVTDGFEQAMEALRRAPYGVVDEALWEVEGSVLREVRGHLEAWERVVRGLEAGRGVVRGELACRDGVAGLVRRLPGPVAELFGESLGEVDGRYIELTVEDAAAPGGEGGWWWGRRPRAGWA